jgi:hypothetical protein
MAITIPADLTIVTLRSRGRELAQRWTDAYASSVLQQASDILRARTNIEFSRAAFEQVVEEMPSGTAAETVDEAGYHFLAATYKAVHGVRALLVDRVARTELGGQSRQQTRVCLIAYNSDLAATSRMMAHELGHLLSLPHVDSGRRPGPGHERQAAAWMRNLMYSGALNPAAELTQTQVQAARSSPLARRFGGR